MNRLPGEEYSGSRFFVTTIYRIGGKQKIELKFILEFPQNVILK